MLHAPKGKIQISALIAILALGTFNNDTQANPFAAYSKCYQDWWCVEEKPLGDNSLQIWLENKTEHPVTVTVEVMNDNLIDAVGSPTPHHVSTTLSAHQHINVISLTTEQASKVRWLDTRYHWVGGVLNAKHDINTQYQLPFAPGKNYPMVQGFNGGYSHFGASKYAVDFAMPIGTAVHAARDGIVIEIEQQYDRGGASRRYAQYANYVVLLHADGTTGEYFHLLKDGVSVSLGEAVSKGQFIALSGNSGFSSMPHLHFAVYQAKPFGEFQSIPFEFE